MKIDRVSINIGPGANFICASVLSLVSVLCLNNSALGQSLAQAPGQAANTSFNTPLNSPPMQESLPNQGAGGYPAQMGQPLYGQPSSPPYGSERAMVPAPLPVPAGIVVTTTLNVDGYRIREYKGIVRGAMVREPTVGQNFKAGFQGMFGGKIGAYVTMCEQGRQQSYDAMVAKAQALGANAIVGVRYDSNSFSADSNQFATEVVCYGTAVLIEPLR